MKLKLTQLFMLAAMAASYGAGAQANGEYRSIAAGNYSNAATWEKYDSVTVSWIPATAKPGSTANVTVRHSLILDGTSTHNSKNLTITSAGSIKSDGTKQQTLRSYGNLITNDGVVGGTGFEDSITVEAALTTGSVTLTGAGSAVVNRIRSYYGVATTFNIDQNITVNYAKAGSLTGYYNNSSSVATESATININAGKTVTMVDSAVLHSNSAATANPGGTYIYNINGILDMSASGGTSNLVPNSQSATSSVQLNVAGLMKIGAGFNTVNSAPGATNGTVALNIAAGGVVDASATKKLTLGTGAFVVAPTAILKRVVAATDTLYPVSVTASGYNAVSMSNSGTADTISVSLKNTFDGLTPDVTKLVTRQWTISEKTAGGSNATIKFYWLAADGASGFSASSVSVYRYDGTSWVAFPATVTGTGTLADPYAAAISGVTAFGRFIVGNSGLPTNVGISSVSKNGGSLTVAPNPVNSRTVRLQLDNLTAGTYHVAVYNVTGQIVAANDVVVAGKAVAHSIELPAHTAAGVYEVKVNNGEGKMAQRIIVQ